MAVGRVLTVKPGADLGYTLPQRIRLEGVGKSTNVSFRVRRICGKSTILVKSGDTVIARFKRDRLAPGEMEHIALPRLLLDEANDYKVTGNGCPNGIAYGKEELTHPTRIITSTVRAEGCLHSRCPVKTSKPVPKGQMAEVVAALDSVVLHAPIHVGDVVLTDVCGTGADIVTCRDMA